MILVISLNPALDVTHHVDGVDWAGVNRPVAVRARPGGKGLNVARTLRSLGADVLVLGLAGGSTGEQVRSSLGAAGVRAELTRIAGETRRTFAVVDTRRAEVALFNEPGPRIGGREYAEFCVSYQRALPVSAAVVLSGSLPPGVATGSYAELTGLAAAAGVPVVLDTSGPALPRAVAAGPALVKPNLAELAAGAGRSLSAGGGPQLPAIKAAASGLIAAGARAVVVSLGPAGLVAVTEEDTWRAEPGRPAAGNPTGAGDAVVAGLTDGLVRGRPWADRLRHAVALGAAAAAAPVAGEFGQADYQRALAAARVTRCGRRR